MSSNKYADQQKNSMGVIEEEEGGDHSLTEDKIDIGSSKKKQKKTSVLFLSKTVKPKTIEISTIGKFQPPDINQQEDEPSPESFESNNSKRSKKKEEPITPNKRDDEERLALTKHEELKVFQDFHNNIQHLIFILFFLRWVLIQRLMRLK